MSDTSRLKTFFAAVPATKTEKWTVRLFLVLFMAIFLLLGSLLGAGLSLFRDNRTRNYVDRERAWCESVSGRVYNYYAGVCYTGVVKIPKEVTESHG